MRLSLLAAAVTMLSAAFGAHASTLNVLEIGTFSAGTPTTAYSSAGGAFSYSFNISSTPTPTASDSGNYFTTSVSNFTYTLNGVSSTPAVSSLYVYNASQAGLFDICFTASCSNSLSFLGPQIYSGSESSPTINTGAFTPVAGESYFFYNNVAYGLSSTSPVIISNVVSTTSAPEVSASGALSVIALLAGMALVTRERRRLSF